MAPGPIRLAAPILALVVFGLLVGFVVGRMAPPSTPGRVLDRAGLAAWLLAIRESGATIDVIASLAIDVSRHPTPLVRECLPFGRCTVLGVLEGFTEHDGTVTVRDQSEAAILPPATGSAALSGPIALRLGRGPIEFLGHIEPASDAPTWSIDDARAATATMPDGHVIAVDGWLVGIDGFPCRPFRGPDIRLD